MKTREMTPRDIACEVFGLYAEGKIRLAVTGDALPQETPETLLYVIRHMPRRELYRMVYDSGAKNVQEAATHVARHVLAAINSGMASRASAIRAEILPATGVECTNTEKTEA